MKWVEGTTWKSEGMPWGERGRGGGEGGEGEDFMVAGFD